MTRERACTALLFFIVLAGMTLMPLPSVRAAAYYVDAGTGRDANSGLTPDTPWKTLGPVNARTFRPGDRILLRAGTRYDGPLRPQGSGALVGERPVPIVLGRYGPGGPPRIDGGGTDPAALALENVEYWEVSDLEITNHGTTPQPHRTGVLLRLRDFGTAHHLCLCRLTVHDVNGSDVKSEGGGAGIAWDIEGGKTPSRFDGLRIEDCRLARCDRNGIIGGGPWSRRAWFPSLHVVIRGNTLEDIGGDGIVPIACDGCQVEHNVVRDSGGRIPAGDAAGIWPWSCDNTVVQFNEVSGQRGPWDAQGFDADWNCRHTLIQYNYSHDNEGGFLLVCDDGGADPADSAGNVGTVVRYNISVGDGFRRTGPHAGFSPTLRVAGPCKDTQVYNNTIIVTPKPPGATDHTLVNLDDWHGWARDTVFTNNVFSTVGQPVRYDFGQAQETIFDHNLYGGRQENAPPDPAGVFAAPLFRDGGHAGAGLSQAAVYRLRRGSPGVAAGRRLPDMGRRDYLGTALPTTHPPALGAIEP